MDKQRRKELQEQFRQMKTYMGIIQVRNQTNNKVFIASTSNLKNRWFTLKGQLDTGCHMNFALQKEWNEMGSDIFIYEVLEQVEVDDTDLPLVKSQKLKKMLEGWLDKLQPYGERGYNRPPKD